jgi:hypothetical protein
VKDEAVARQETASNRHTLSRNTQSQTGRRTWQSTRASQAHLLRLATLRHRAPALLLLRLFLRGLVLLLLAGLTLRACALPGLPSVSNRTCSSTLVSTSKCLPVKSKRKHNTSTNAFASVCHVCACECVPTGGGGSSAKNRRREHTSVCMWCM